MSSGLMYLTALAREIKLHVNSSNVLDWKHSAPVLLILIKRNKSNELDVQTIIHFRSGSIHFRSSFSADKILIQFRDSRSDQRSDVQTWLFMSGPFYFKALSSSVQILVQFGSDPAIESAKRCADLTVQVRFGSLHIIIQFRSSRSDQRRDVQTWLFDSYEGAICLRAWSAALCDWNCARTRSETCNHRRTWIRICALTTPDWRKPQWCAGQNARASGQFWVVEPSNKCKDHVSKKTNISIVVYASYSGNCQSTIVVHATHSENLHIFNRRTNNLPREMPIFNRHPCNPFRRLPMCNHWACNLLGKLPMFNRNPCNPFRKLPISNHRLCNLLRKLPIFNRRACNLLVKKLMCS